MNNYFKYFCLAGSLITLTLVASCSDDDKDNDIPMPEEVTGVSFATQVKPLIEEHCKSCHLNGGNQTNYTLYTNTKNDINLILDRIQRDPSDQGFMPFGGSEQKTALIQILKQWKTDDFPQ